MAMFKKIRVGLLVAAAFGFGVVFANGSLSDTVALAKEKGLTALFQSKQTFANSACVAPSTEQDEIFFLSCGGIF